MAGFSIEEFEKKYVARLETRKLKWISELQEEIDPRYRRGQKSYIGPDNDPNVIDAQNFTLRTMVLPAGCEGPLHMHDDVEEVFFILKGKMVAFIQAEEDGEIYEIPLSDRDCISIPPVVVNRGIKNIGDEEALMLVILSAPQPHPETYPPGSALEELRKQSVKK